MEARFEVWVPLVFLSSNDEVLKVHIERLDLDGVNVQKADGNLVSDEVDEEGSISIEGDSASRNGDGTFSSEVSGWDAFVGEWTGINVASGLVGRFKLNISEVDGELDVERAEVEVIRVGDGREADNIKRSVGATFFNPGDGVESYVKRAFRTLQWIVNCYRQFKLRN